MDRCTGRCDITDMLLKMVLNIIEFVLAEIYFIH